MTVRTATISDLHDSAAYVCLLRRRQPATLGVAADVERIPSNDTVFNTPRNEAAGDVSCLLNTTLEPRRRRLTDGVLNMHVLSCRAAAYRLRRDLCIYSSFLYTRLSDALQASDDLAPTIAGLLEYPAARARAERRRMAAGGAPIGVAGGPMTTVDILHSGSCLPAHIPTLFDSNCVLLPTNVGVRLCTAGDLRLHSHDPTPLVFAVHQEHWVLIAIWPSSCWIEVLDSLYCHERHVAVRRTVLAFLEAAWVYHHGASAYDAATTPFPNAWRYNAARDEGVATRCVRQVQARRRDGRAPEAINPTAVTAGVFQQTNGIDCGFFTAAFMRAASTGMATARTDSVIAFNSAGVTELRHQLYTQYLELACLPQ
jgi:hypothetical protein